jgi:hypothetical protein
MKSNTQKIWIDNIHYVTDEHGNRVCVQIPFTQWEMIQAQLAYEGDSEETVESSALVDKQGIFVVTAKPFRDLTNITRHERHRRVFDLLQQVGL